MIVYKIKPPEVTYTDWELNVANQRITVDNIDYSGTHMGERKVTVVLESAEPIAFQIGDYLIFDTPYDNERFTLQTDPIITRVYNSLMIQYTLTFWWVGYELQITNFLDVVGDEPTDFYYSSNGDVDFYGTITELANKIIYNMDRRGAGVWSVLIDPSVNVLVSKSRFFDNLKCWDVLQYVKSEWGVDFKIQSEIKTIIIGQLPTVVDLEGDLFTFEYGKDKGLCEINRLQNDQKIVTRVYAYGSKRNILRDYRTGDNQQFHPRLMLPELGAIPLTDYTCESGYLENTALSAIYGVREDFYINEEIFPAIGDFFINSAEPIYDRPAEGEPVLTRTVIIPAWIEKVDDPSDPLVTAIFHEGSTQEVIVTEKEFDTFVIYIDNPGFDVNDPAIKTGVNAKISFSTGLLQGNEFEIHEWTKVLNPTWDNTYKVTLKRYVNGSGYVIPNSTIVPAMGDQIVFLDINQPDDYIADAEARLLEDAKVWLADRTQSPNGYSIKIPEEFVAKFEGIERYLRESNAVLIQDVILGLSPQSVLIQSISISYKAEAKLPTYTLTVSDKPVKSKLAVLESQLKSANQLISNTKNTTNVIQQNILKSARVFQQAITNNYNNIYGDIISPQSILPSSLSVDVRSDNYILQAYFSVNYGGDANAAYGSSGVLIHRDGDITWGDAFDLTHQTWTIAAPQTFTLDPIKAYWVYIKGSLTDGTAIWVVSETKIMALALEGYMMFTWGNIIPVRDGIRYSQNAHGINGVSAYVYVAYGTSLSGDGFTMTNDPELRFMAIKSSPTEIETPVVGDFVGLWFERKGGLLVEVVSDKHYRHTQGIPATTWTIAHNLGKYPSVTVVDTSGTEYECDVTHIDANNCIIHFSVGFSGYADLN